MVNTFNGKEITYDYNSVTYEYKYKDLPMHRSYLGLVDKGIVVCRNSIWIGDVMLFDTNSEVYITSFTKVAEKGNNTLYEFMLSDESIKYFVCTTTESK